jgi:murein L,D-transpeptidase YafK
VWLLLLALVAPAASDPCAGVGTAIYVNVERRVLYVCESGQKKAAHRVALGRGGVDKRAEGDAKVPLGEYRLGAPRPSRAFHLFIPVGYPTADQRRRGLTGGAVGIHGPSRMWQGPLTTDVDWTLGCVAVGTDDEIESIANWVRLKRAPRIVIRRR